MKICYRDKFIYGFVATIKLYNFARILGGDVAQMVEQRTENP